jgi:hypothetical protein
MTAAETEEQADVSACISSSLSISATFDLQRNGRNGTNKNASTAFNAQIRVNGGNVFRIKAERVVRTFINTKAAAYTFISINGYCHRFLLQNYYKNRLSMII